MTEKEFVALLAIEGKQLDIAEAVKTVGDITEKGYMADINEGFFKTVMSGDFKKRRREAVQDLIKKYYKNANN
jgi:hypothetical protein